MDGGPQVYGAPIQPMQGYAQPLAAPQGSPMAPARDGGPVFYPGAPPNGQGGAVGAPGMPPGSPPGGAYSSPGGTGVIGGPSIYGQPSPQWNPGPRGIR